MTTARHHRQEQRQSGYSLVEAIIYIALFVALSVFFVDTLLVLSKAYTETRVNRDLLDSAQVTIERLSREVRAANNIETTSSPSTLLLDTTYADGTAKTVQFSLSSSGTAVAFTDNGVPAGDLTSDQVDVTSLAFTPIVTQYGKAVRVQMTLQSLRSPSGKTISISDTIALRSAY